MPRFQRVPPRRPLPWSTTLRLWTFFAAALVGLLGLVAWSERLPPTVPASAPAAEFSAARARPALSHLADTLGHRVPGTPAHAATRDYLVRRLAALPGVQVAVQDTVGARVGAQGLRVYRVQNVLARIPGRRAPAVLLSAHYDSPAESVGAADDAVAVAAMLEIARALSAGPPPEHTVVLHFNDAEEQGLLGAEAALAHPWLAPVRAFVNLESAGNVGKAILFQAGPENAWLTRRYARAVPHPYGSVIGQDIFQSGLIPSGTDFAIYTGGGGMRGLDVAFYRGGYAYHTALDQAAAVAPGSLQHMGANALAAVRALAAGPLPGDVGGSPSVYYDVLGLVMLAYDRTVATVLAVAALLLLGLALRRVTARELASAREIAVAAGLAAIGLLLAPALAVGAAMIGPYVLARPHGWFAHPGRAVVAYGGLALAALLLAQWLYARRRAARAVAPATRTVAAWAGALTVLGVLLLGLTLLGIGSGYLLLWWVTGGALGLLLLARGREPRWPGAVAVGVIPGAVLTAQTTYLLVALFAPIAGRFPAPIPFDPVLAAIITVPVVVLLLVPSALLQRGERLGAATGLALLLAAGGLLAVWVSFPYTPARPQRLVVEHRDDPDGSRLALAAADHPGPALAARLASGGPLAPSGGADGTLWFPAPPLPEPPAALTLVAERTTASGGRELDLLLTSNAYEVTVRTPESRPARWRIAGVTTAPRALTRATFIAAPDSGWRLTLAVPGTAPLPLEIVTRRHRPSAAAEALMARLPDWSTAFGETVVRRRATS